MFAILKELVEKAQEKGLVAMAIQTASGSVYLVTTIPGDTQVLLTKMSQNGGSIGPGESFEGPSWEVSDWDDGKRFILHDGKSWALRTSPIIAIHGSGEFSQVKAPLPQE